MFLYYLYWYNRGDNMNEAKKSEKKVCTEDNEFGFQEGEYCY